VDLAGVVGVVEKLLSVEPIASAFSLEIAKADLKGSRAIDQR
jgi:hypothetical protein